MKLAWIFTLYILGSCVHQPDGIVASVSAYSGEELEASTPICFETSQNQQQSDLALENEFIGDEIIRVCTKAAERNEIVVKKDPKCIRAVISWAVSPPSTINQGSTSVCNPVFGSYYCSSQTYSQTLWTKGIWIRFYRPGEKKPVHEVRSITSTSRPEILTTTATGLCRGALTEFPEAFQLRKYRVATDFEDHRTIFEKMLSFLDD